MENGCLNTDIVIIIYYTTPPSLPSIHPDGYNALSEEILESLSSIAASYSDFGQYLPTVLTGTASSLPEVGRKKPLYTNTKSEAHPTQALPRHNFDRYNNVAWQGGDEVLRELVYPKGMERKCVCPIIIQWYAMIAIYLVLV